MSSALIEQTEHPKKALLLQKLGAEAHGNVSQAAALVGVGRTTVYEWAKHDETFAQAMGEARKEGVESGLDMAESALMKAIGQGNMTAIIFYLKTQGKHRGYIERQELSGSHTEGPIKIIELGHSQMTLG